MVVLTTFTQPAEGIRHRQPNTTTYVNDNNLGKGTLFIAESCLSWISDSGDGFSIEYPNISLHAVSRDLAAFPQECLFLMLDIALGDEETKNGDGEINEDNDGSDNDDQASTELRFVPDDRGMLDAMFHAMNACQALHPDPEDSVSDEDFYGDTDDDIQMEETDSRMANLNMRVERTWNTTLMMDNNHMGLELRDISGSDWGRVEDRVEDREEDKVEDRVEDRVEYRAVEGMAGGMAEGGAVGRAVDRAVDSMGEVAGWRCRVQSMEDMEDFQLDRVQGDRSFHLGNTEIQDSSAPILQVQTPYTASNFSDAES